MAIFISMTPILVTDSIFIDALADNGRHSTVKGAQVNGENTPEGILPKSPYTRGLKFAKVVVPPLPLLCLESLKKVPVPKF